MPQTYAEIVTAQRYEEARREHNVCALGNGENPHPPTYGGAALCVSCPASGTADCASCVDIQRWMAEGVWVLDEAQRLIDEIPFDGSVIPSNDEPTNPVRPEGMSDAEWNEYQTWRVEEAAANAAIAKHALANARAEAPPQEPRKPLPAQLSKVARAQGRTGQYTEAEKMAAITKMLNDTAGKRNHFYTGGEHRVTWL